MLVFKHNELGAQVTCTLRSTGDTYCFSMELRYSWQHKGEKTAYNKYSESKWTHRVIDKLVS